MKSACRNVVAHVACRVSNGRDAPRRVRNAEPASLRASRETECFAPAEKLRSGEAEKNGEMKSACRNVVVHVECRVSTT
ncbi:MAG: hypothetical protein IJR99_02930 [Kiritimatiellae bacterium]|nr:hypothetical protein [Kiritimatiellia bacterium]